MDRRRQILVAEDRPEIVTIWASALTRAGWAVTVARDGYEALDQLARASFAMVVCDLHLGPDTGRARVRTALRYLDRVLYRPDITVARVAAAAGVSAEHLARLFRRHVGRTPLEVIHTLRIRQAEKMLPNPNLTVHDVGRECGYKSPQQFASWFRWKHGMSPQEWRTAHMGLDEIHLR